MSLIPACDPVTQEAPDGGSGDQQDAGPFCGWEEQPPSNFDPCAAGDAEEDWIVGADYAYDTTDGNAGDAQAPPSQTLTLDNGYQVRLVRVGQFEVSGGATLSLAGDRGLLIAADEARVAGVIDVGSGADLAEVCPNLDGAAEGEVGGGGGAGGSFGAFGGPGGPDADGNGGGEVGELFGDSLLVPLFGGCSGGHGPGPTGNAFAAGGAGGGALQISARTSLSVAGRIDAGGGGGEGGVIGEGDGCAPNSQCGYGGGGGGSGGGLFLESVSMDIASGAALCANGGGGGQGGHSSTNAEGTPGEDALCADQAARGGEGGIGAEGGRGGTASSTDGFPGNGSGSADVGGGGGGGGVGRIRLNAGNGSAALDDSAIVTPTPVGP